MEGKTVILSVLIIMSLVMAQIQVEASNLCCPSRQARNVFNFCSFTGHPKQLCVRIAGCKLVDGTCPGGYNHDILENSGDIDPVNEYCKLGCASSVCSALTALENSDASEIVNGAVEKCTEACSTFCTKGSLETTV